MSGWLFILLSSACSVLIAHFLKVTEHKNLSTIKVLTVNYLVASFVAFSSPSGVSLTSLISDVSNIWPALLAATLVGLIFIANFFIYSKSVNKNGVGISVAAMRMSLVIPVLLSTLWYSESMVYRQWFGFLLVAIALYLLMPFKKTLLKKTNGAAWLLALLFLGTGLGDGSLKVFEEDFSTLLTKEQFMGTVFFSALIIGCAAVALTGNWKFSKGELGLGILVGIPNLYSAIFLIEALVQMNGAVVYSIVNILTVLGATAVGMVKWRDRISPLQWAGIASSIYAILLLK